MSVFPLVVAVLVLFNRNEFRRLIVASNFTEGFSWIKVTFTYFLGFGIGGGGSIVWTVNTSEVEERLILAKGVEFVEVLT